MASSPAELFRAMAERIERNDPAEFAGAILIVPPPNRDGREDEPIEVLFVDPSRDVAMFWGTLRTKVEREGAQATALAEQQRQMLSQTWR